MRIGSRNIYAMDVAVVVGTLVALIAVVGYARPLVISPLDDIKTTNRSVLFSLEKGESVLIDDNPDFTSPERVYVDEESEVTLSPGIYYWKAEGIIDSKVRKIVIESEINLVLVNSDEGYQVVNEGNVETNVSFYEYGVVKGSRILGVNEGANASGTLIFGRQNE